MVLGYIGAFFAFCTALYSMKRLRRIINPITVFCGLWSVILLFSSMELYDLKSSSMHTYLCITIGVVFFVIGFFIDYDFIKTKSLCLGKPNNGIPYVYEPRYVVIYVVVVFLLLSSVSNVMESVRVLLQGGNLETIHVLLRTSSGDARGTIGNVIYNLLTGPISYAMYPICAYNVVNRKEKLLSIAIIVLLLFGILTSGGRSLLIYFGISIVVAFMFSQEKSKAIKEKLSSIRRNKRKFNAFVVAFVIFFIIVSFSRSGQKLFEHTYLYFGMQPTMFEQWADVVETKNLIGFGEASLNGFTFHFLYLFKNSLGLTYPEHWYDVYNTILSVDSVWKPITNAGLPANAYVSVFWYFYLDGREIGIIILSLLFGIFCSHYYRLVIRKTNIKNICLYSMVLFSVFDTYVRMRFTVAEFTGGFLLLSFLLFRKKRIRIKNNLG